MQEAHAMQEKVSAQYVNEIEMAKSQRDFELKKAAYDVEVNTKKAESEMAYQLQVQSPALHQSMKSVSSLLGWMTDACLICLFFLVLSPGGQNQAAHRGGEDADPGGGAHAADHSAGAGDHPQGEGTGG